MGGLFLPCGWNTEKSEVGTSGGASRVPHTIWVDVDSYFSKAYVLGTGWDQTSWSISWALIIDLGRGANLGA